MNWISLIAKPLLVVIAALLLMGTSSCDDLFGSSKKSSRGSSTPPPGGTPPPGDTPPPAATDLMLGLQLVADGLTFPTAMAAPPGDTERVFVAEKGGRILIIRDGTVLAQPFLDISNELYQGDEVGLLGLAFDPDYDNNGRFFVSYVDVADTTQLVRYEVSADPDVADATTGVLIISEPQPDPYHNGGMIAFGPDGMLYLALGDGNYGDGSGDPEGHAQNKATPFGGLLRIDVSGDGYEIPADNPFVGEAGARGELWAIGFRNPWRFAFDPETGDLYIADVGHEPPTAREEVNVAPGPDAGKGLNFGWNAFEGTECFNAALGCDDTGLTPPLVEYAHPAGSGGICSASVTGGYVYRGAAIPELAGTYFYSDFCVSWVRSFRHEGGQAVGETEWENLRPPGGNVVSFGEDADGELYLLTMQGQVYRIVMVSECPVPPVAAFDTSAPPAIAVPAATFGGNLLLDSGFEEPVRVGFAPEGFGYWRFDESLSVGAQQGITPRSGERMLQFVGSSRDSTQFGTASAAEQIQLVDLSALADQIDAGEVTAMASAWFARVAGCPETDDAFGVYLLAFDGEPETFGTRWTNGVNAAVAQGVPRDLADMTGVDGWLRHRASSFRHNDPADRVAGGDTPDDFEGDVFAWRRGEVVMDVPPQTRFLAVIVIALENVRNDLEFPEFHGHYADDATLVLTLTQ